MRRILVIASVLASLLVPLAPAPPAGAVTAGACSWNSSIVYQQGLAPIVPPTTGTSNLQIVLNLACVGVGTSSWNLAGTGSASGSCANEISTAQLQDGQGAFATATWIRAGVTGWMFLLVATPGGPSTQYTFDGPFVWQSAGPGDCITTFAAQAVMTGVARNIGV